MTILNETKRMHEILGELRFDDGKGDPTIGLENGAPFWLARPMGWSSDGVEILLSGNSSGPAPDSLERAIQAFNSLEKIEQEGRESIRPIIMNAPTPARDVNDYEANLLWIDCQQTKTIVVFNWDGFTYVRWDATLNEENRIIDLQQTTW